MVYEKYNQIGSFFIFLFISVVWVFSYSSEHGLKAIVEVIWYGPEPTEAPFE